MSVRKWSPFAVFNTIVLLFVVVVTLYPFLHMIAVSLSANTAVMKGSVSLIPKGFQVDMYRIVLNDPRIASGYRNTLIYVTLGTTISLLVTALGAYALSRRTFLFRRGFMLIIIFTILFSGGMIPTFLVVNELGLVNTMWAMILPGAVSTWNLIIMRTFFEQLPVEMIEAGKIDGLHDLSLFVRIVLPVSKPILATIGLFYAVGIWNNFYSALLYLRDSELYPLQLILRNMVVVPDNIVSQGMGSELVIEESLKYATILVSTLPILLVYPFLQKYFVKGALIGSVKG
ncbi:carbohydrate ABC transporter permease [Paenibacillus cymbidii]|uniref:carbohydrate ABC transporter permease n=1 Tax=Paenibacillus cymbidii TaxID=1639034 RepID=UPI001F1BD5D2|nr:carbohydrate ABC transporter permease [Paenibacillus cymbidii]